MKMSEQGLEMLKEFEGCVLHVYRDQAGLATIGVGHLLTKEEKETKKIKIGDEVVDLVQSGVITKEQALTLLAQDITPAEKAVAKSVKVELNQKQFDCLVSFTFNCGVGALQNSTLLKKLNGGDYSAVPIELMKWVKAGGERCGDLVLRRRAEGKLFVAAV